MVCSFQAHFATHILQGIWTGSWSHKYLVWPGDGQPRRVVCTGFGVGGSIAAVAAVILAVEYPLASVRCVTVDSPVITYGSPGFACLYRCGILVSRLDGNLACSHLTPLLAGYGSYTICFTLEAMRNAVHHVLQSHKVYNASFPKVAQVSYLELAASRSETRARCIPSEPSCTHWR
jgi:hypothetical protein